MKLKLLCIFYIIAGLALGVTIVTMLFSNPFVTGVLCFLGGYRWVNYVFNWYGTEKAKNMPLAKTIALDDDDDNEIEFKDL